MGFVKFFAEKVGIEYIFSMSTNGFLLNKNISNELVNYFKIKNFQVTLDGPPTIHNKYRPLANGGKTYERILKNLIALKNSPWEFKILLRINIDKNSYKEVIDWIPEIAKFFGGDERFSIFPFRIFSSPKYTCSQTVEVSQIIELLKVAANCGLKNNILTQFAPYSICYAARPLSLVIAPDGKIHKCTAAFDLEQNLLGHIKNNGNIEEFNTIRLREWVYSFEKTTKSCKTCFLYPVCLGVKCPLPVVKGKGPFCPPLKDFVDDLIMLDRALSSTTLESSNIKKEVR